MATDAGARGDRQARRHAARPDLRRRPHDRRRADSRCSSRAARSAPARSATRARPTGLELQSEPAEPIARDLRRGAVVAGGAAPRGLPPSPGLQDYLRAWPAGRGSRSKSFRSCASSAARAAASPTARRRYVIAGLTFVDRLRAELRRSCSSRCAGSGGPGRRTSSVARAPRPRLSGRAAADWPRTTRVLPWSVAGAHHDVLAHPVRQDPARDPGADRPHARPARPAGRRSRSG